MGEFFRSNYFLIFLGAVAWLVIAGIAGIAWNVYCTLTKRPSSFEDMSISRDRAAIDQAVKEMVREMEVARSLNLQQPPKAPEGPFWGVDCRDLNNYQDGRLRFILVKNVDGQLVPAGEAVITDVAPSEDVQLLGDYAYAQDWMTCYSEDLQRAIARRKERPTVWDRIEEEAS